MFAAYSTVAVETGIFHDSFGAVDANKDQHRQHLDRFRALGATLSGRSS